MAPDGPLDEPSTDGPGTVMLEAVPRVRAVLRDLLRHGLQRVTTGTGVELAAASQWAHHARLTRVERELMALQAQVDKYLARDPLFRTDAFVDRVNRLAWRLAEIEHHLSDGRTADELVPLVGVPRRRYEPIDGELLVVAVALRTWVSDTGFMGVTAQLWAPEEERMVEVGLARPTDYFGTDPSRLVFQLLNDAIGVSMQELSHGAWHLEGIKLSADGRISLPGDAWARPAASPLSDALASLRCDDLLQVVDRLMDDVLTPIDGGGGAWVYLEPAAIGPRRVDDTRTEATATLVDRRGAEALLRVPLGAERAQQVENLDHLSRPDTRPDGLVVQARVVGDALHLEPVTAVFHDAVQLKQRRRTLEVQLVHLAAEPLGMVRR